MKHRKIKNQKNIAVNDSKSEFIERMERELFVSEAELDYHGLGPITPFEVERMLDEFLEDSYVSGCKYVTIITGKGQKVRPQVQNLLKRNKFVESFKTAGYFNGQEGAFEVVLRNLPACHAAAGR